MQKPTVGRSVHYFDRDELVTANEQNRKPQPYAATVTRVYLDPSTDDVSERVDLAVFDPELGYQQKRGVSRRSEDAPFSVWDWPVIEKPAAPATTEEPAGKTAKAAGGKKK